MNRIISTALLVCFVSMGFCQEKNDNELKSYSSNTNDNGASSAEIEITFQEDLGPFKINYNGLEYSTTNNKFLLSNLPCGDHTVKVSSVNPPFKSKIFSRSIYQYIPDIYFIPLDSCINIAIDTICKLAVPMHKVKSVQWEPSEAFSDPNGLNTRLCKNVSEISVKFEDLTGDTIYQKSIAIYTKLNNWDDPFNPDPFANESTLKIYDRNSKQDLVQKYISRFSKLREREERYIGKFTGRYGFFEWEKMISIDEKIFVVPVVKIGRPIASSYIIIALSNSGLHSIFVNREELINDYKNQSSKTSEMEAKISLMKLVDFTFPGMLDPNISTQDETFPKFKNSELCIGKYTINIFSNESSSVRFDKTFKVSDSENQCDMLDFLTYPVGADLYLDPNVSTASEAFQIFMKKCCNL